MRALLDVNVLIALLDASHAFHERAHAWWSNHSSSGWASCPLTENGTIRIMSQTAYSKSRRFTICELITALREFAGGSDHQFWSDDLSLRDPERFAPDRIHGGGGLTDLYLLALASGREGRLVTFDRGIPLNAVPGAGNKNLEVI
jgi:toxin-antitoxin system PIN domain toxin